MLGRAAFNQLERRATSELGKNLANGAVDTMQNVVQGTVTDGVADFVHGATGHRPNIQTGAPTIGSFGALGYTYLVGKYNAGVARDLTSDGIPSQGTMFQLGASARQVSQVDRIRAMTGGSTRS